LCLFEKVSLTVYDWDILVLFLTITPVMLPQPATQALEKSMSIDVFTFGETMLRLAPPANIPLEATGNFAVTPGGAESNVAANLAHLGWHSAWFSRLPDTPLGTLTAQMIRAHGVNTDSVSYVSGERMGLYFVEFGAAPRGIRVWYDRAQSAASHMQPDDLPYEAIAQSRWLHMTGITPALSANCRQTVRAALDFARSRGITVSFDVNYRALLWSAADAARTLEPFCKDADVVMIARRDAINLFHAPDDLHTCVQQLQQRWGGTVAVTAGDAGAAASSGTDVFSSPALPVTIIDRVGAGDAFSSGMIGCLLDGHDLQYALRFSTALSALKLTIPGDIAIITRAQVEALMGGSAAELRR
jgi:2-dehydro-3-deoxygluconokinase